MFQIGDRVVYGIHGVCSIHGIDVQRVNRKRVEYYVLVPQSQPDARFLVPTQNQTALSKLRPLLSQQQIHDLLTIGMINHYAWIEDENQRKHQYRELINSGDCAGLIGMIRLLYQHKEHQLSQGRKFHMCDENFLRDAEKLLASEFSYVLNIPQTEVGRYIQDNLK